MLVYSSDSSALPMVDIPGRWKETSDFSPSLILSLASVCTVQGPRHLVLMDSCPHHHG